MTGKKSRWALIGAMTAVLALASLAGPTGPARAGTADLASRMLETSDLPAGFQPYLPLTGPLNAQRAQQLGDTRAIAKVAGLLSGWARVWISRQTGQIVFEIVIDTGTRGNARTWAGSFGSGMLAGGATRRPLTADLVGYVTSGQPDGVPYIAVSAPLAQGPFFFILKVDAPARSLPAAARLLVSLASAQDRRVPADTPDTGTPQPNLRFDVYLAAGSTVGILLGYLLVVSGVAYLRDPLRRDRRRERPLAGRWKPSGPHVLDVSNPARIYRNKARLRLAVQLIGLTLIVGGADHLLGVAGVDQSVDPHIGPADYLYVLAGVAVTWAGGRFIHPSGFGRARGQRVLAGGRRVRVTALMSLAVVLIGGGTVTLVGYGVMQSEPAVVQQADGVTYGPHQGGWVGWVTAGLIYVGAGAILARIARRLAAVDANRLMQRDTRPPVLYLRSFGDDKLNLWTATFGRLSLLERFTPRRFDAFEEVIARHFAVTGPVVALNPPETRLAPLGAARETLDSADWQATITDWMRRAAVIVLVVPPGRVTSGLDWELRQVSANGFWDKTLILVPPVPLVALHARWQGFLAACGGFWPFASPLPTAPPRLLALTFRNAAWAVIRADRADEWTYSAAITHALSAPRLPAATVVAP